MCNRESFQTQAIGLWRRTLRRPQNLSPTSSNVAMRRAPLSASPKAANSRQGLYEKNDTVIVNQRRENAHSITGCHDLHCTSYAYISRCRGTNRQERLHIAAVACD